MDSNGQQTKLPFVASHCTIAEHRGTISGTRSRKPSMNIHIGYATIVDVSVTGHDGKTKEGWALQGRIAP